MLETTNAVDAGTDVKVHFMDFKRADFINQLPKLRDTLSTLFDDYCSSKGSECTFQGYQLQKLINELFINKLFCIKLFFLLFVCFYLSVIYYLMLLETQRVSASASQARPKKRNSTKITAT